METPTAAQVRERSALLAFLFPESDGPKSAQLQLLLDDDAPLVSSLTGRIIGPEGTPGEEVPDYLRPLAFRVMAYRAERAGVWRGSAKDAQKLIKDARLRSISAGPWSETYMRPEEVDLARRKMLDVDMTISDLLWALATTERQQEWLAFWTGRNAPAAAVQSFDWRGQRAQRDEYGVPRFRN